MAIAVSAHASASFGLGNDRDWLSRPCVDAVSGFATGGGIFRSRVGVRMAYCDLLVSGSGMARHIQKWTFGGTVRCHDAALAGAALRPKDAGDWFVIDCFCGFWLLMAPYRG